MAQANYATCSNCGQVKPVCCDSGYADLEDGTTKHDDPFCETCCQNHPYRRVKTGVVVEEVSNVVTLDTALVGVLKQYMEGAITYGEFIQWVMSNIPPPCDDPANDTVYRCLIAGARTAMDLELAQFDTEQEEENRSKREVMQREEREQGHGGRVGGDQRQSRRRRS